MKAPRGIVAILVGPDGREVAHAAVFDTSGPGYGLREAQEMKVRRALANAAMRALSSPALSDSINTYTAEQIMGAMCATGHRVVIVPIGTCEGPSEGAEVAA